MGYFVVLAWNCLASTLDYIVMQMRKTNREKGYCTPISLITTSKGLVATLTKGQRTMELSLLYNLHLSRHNNTWTMSIFCR